jgi:hypothetical protein
MSLFFAYPGTDLVPDAPSASVIGPFPTREEAEKHPRPLRGGLPHPWRIIEAPDMESAQRLALEAFGLQRP